MQGFLAGIPDGRSMVTRARLLRAIRPELGLGLDAFLSLLLADLAVLEVAALDGALRRLVPLRQPVAERVAVPARLRAQLRQPALLPVFSRALREFIFGERKLRHISCHCRGHKQGAMILLPVLQ